MFFRFPPDARWSDERAAVEFGIGIGEYEGVERIPRRVFQRVLDQAPTPERCFAGYHLHRTRLELIGGSAIPPTSDPGCPELELPPRIVLGGWRQATKPFVVCRLTEI